jgi:hypothetical protein
MTSTRVDTLQFRRPDGDVVELVVPPVMNQDWMGKVIFSDYTVRLVRAERPASEAEYSSIALAEGRTVGYLIPSTAILSVENPNNGDAAYSAYNIIAARIICELSQRGEYSLVDPACTRATGPQTIFMNDCYYLITWDKHIPNSQNFTRDYAVSLCAKGLVFDHQGQKPIALSTQYESSQRTMRLRATQGLPDYVVSILTELIPFTHSPFLRFFYLYQVVEYLMAERFADEVKRLQAELATAGTHSVVDVKDALKRFQAATSEDSRINGVLLPPCPTTLLVAGRLLDSLSVDHVSMTFAAKIYRIRNTLFHDYRRLHGATGDLTDLSTGLFAYLLESKMPY